MYIWGMKLETLLYYLWEAEKNWTTVHTIYEKQRKTELQYKLPKNILIIFM